MDPWLGRSIIIIIIIIYHSPSVVISSCCPILIQIRIQKRKNNEE